MATSEKIQMSEMPRIENQLFVNDRMLLALLRRCGHDVPKDTIIEWHWDGARIKWTTSIL